ncbi:hypothetical protein BJY04DRAFT_225478 [Aspergillus karnatakaensis]|uniref:tRNA methyltransferase PPM2 n=1 Tax=Aspergillus karnatakaensis TaxID=1810916 RepID=UPI003CCD2EFF
MEKSNQAKPESKEEKSANSVMETNSSSIVCKRSVEMLYYPEPHIFRHFVKKPQRRAPLINRVYWLRMRAMEETVRRFMREPSDKPKFVLNLGCGFDALPFILLSTDRSLCSGTVFVDVDYEKLMVNKKAAVQKSKVVTQLLHNVDFKTDESAVQIRSDQYIAIGCDLKNLDKLDHVLKTEVLPADCTVLFLAEVSIAYMDVGSANAVVKWASNLSKDARFCMLEQCSPDGPDHPFASTMLKHYKKLGAPLYSIYEYPTLADQELRFTKAGWAHAHARSLWDLWSDDEYVDCALRTSLDAVELFDEWEELALFASHYFILHASTRPGPSKYAVASAGPSHQANSKSGEYKLISNCTTPTGQRRFGSLIPGINGTVGFHAGLGRQGRLADTDIYSTSKGSSASLLSCPPRDITARLCHTITSFNQAGDCLLVGGRTSPAAALHDCWVRKDNAWHASSSLPVARFRHGATKVTLGSDSVLIYGGKASDGTILDTWLLWSDDAEGWKTVETQEHGTTPEPRFGASFSNLGNASGVLFGGIGAHSTILKDFWTWKLNRRPDGSVYVELTDQSESLRNVTPEVELLSRFGATVTPTPWGLVVAGGIIPRRILPSDAEILLLDSAALLKCIESGSLVDSPAFFTIGLDPGYAGPRPLLVGHASCAVNSDQVLLVGGGAVCFPHGTAWTEGSWTLSRADSPLENNWTIIREGIQSAKAELIQSAKDKPKSHASTTQMSTIPRVKVEDSVQFQKILAGSRPVIIEGSDIGPCTELWTKEYLVDKVGNDRKVVVHKAETENMSFQTKNFDYTSKPFGAFMDEVYAGGRQYLRSISVDQPTKQPATLDLDFPGLKDDFRLPEALSTVIENAHSSPLRISGPVTLWLHYDVMANVLCQIRGEKRLILFPPSDVQYLDVPAGASSSNINIFQNRADQSIASIPGTSPHEALLKRGDILFLPPLWLHTAAPLGEVSVAVNVFFRNLSQGYAAGRDVYGNRDVQAYEKGRKDLEKMVKSFADLPPDMGRFYLLRLAGELQEMAEV